MCVLEWNNYSVIKRALLYGFLMSLMIAALRNTSLTFFPCKLPFSWCGASSLLILPVEDVLQNIGPHTKGLQPDLLRVSVY